MSHDLDDFDLSYNQLCPPYPDCIPNDALSYMEPSNCYIFGDINNDLEVNVLDIVIIVSYVLMTDYPTNMELYIGDINFDGELNILDIVLQTKLGNSKSEIRRMIKNNGLRINNEIVANEAKIINKNDFDENNNMKISHGKKQHIIVKLI